MSNPAISREDVHAYAEACSEMGMEFQTIAARLLKSQTRLKNFIEQNFTGVDPLAGQVALYMFTVCLRVFDQAGGRLKKANSDDLNRAQQKVNTSLEGLLPIDGAFSERAKEIEGRAQPHLLDEILWALYDRDKDERKDEETVLDDNQSAMIYLMLWTTVEALDGKWRP